MLSDASHFSDASILVPPVLAHCLRFFDGDHTELDLREELVRITGRIEVGEIVEHLMGTLSASGFLEDEAFAAMRDERMREFADAPRRAAAHAGLAYPEDTLELRETMIRWLDGARRPLPGLVGIAAPHVSPDGGCRSYAAAYGALGDEVKHRTFLILATSHSGEPGRFGLTRKPFVTPLGETPADTELVRELAATGGAAVEMEDYCHSFEHTVELQVVFLQHLFGPDIRILPVLCGGFASVYQGGKPEDDPHVARFLDALRDLASRHRERLFWVLGIDMAHMGSRYQDEFPCTAGQGVMAEVEQQDRARIERVLAGDADGYWALLHGDPLKWCGSAPLYTFLRAAPGVRGELLCYEQWNIDPESVVSFAGIAFKQGQAAG